MRARQSVIRSKNASKKRRGEREGEQRRSDACPFRYHVIRDTALAVTRSCPIMIRCAGAKANIYGLGEHPDPFLLDETNTTWFP